MKSLLKLIKVKVKRILKTSSNIIITYDERELERELEKEFARELRQKRITEKWSVDMMSEYYNVPNNYMKEVLEYFSIR